MESMETDTQIPQNGDAGENTPPRRRSRFEEAPEDVKGNIPPPGRYTPGAAPMMRPPGLMVPPGARPIPRPLMSANMDEEPPSFFNNTPPRASSIPPRGPRPARPGLGYAPRPGFPPRPGFAPPVGVPPGQMAPGFRPPANPQDNIKRWFELAGIEDEVWVETKASADKYYYYHAVTRATVWQRPEGEKVRVVDQAGLQAIVEQGMKAEREKNPQGIPPLMPGGYPAGYPPVGAVPARMPTDPDSAWAQFVSPEGRPYYYNSITGENTWEKPKALIEKEKNGTSLKPVPVGPTPGYPQAVAQPTPGYPQAVAQPTPGYPQAIAQPTPVTSNTVSQPAASGDASRPVTSLPVSGTPWCVVWTGDGRVFFFNPTTKTSLWQRPPELYNRPDVDLMVTKRPEPDENGSAGTTLNPAKVRNEPENESGTEEEDEDSKAPPRKKTRQEKKQEKLEEQKRAAESERKEKAKPKPKVIDPAIEAEKKAQETRAQIPLEERKKQFREMMEERNVSANSTFQKELSKIVFDPRYLLLSASERRDCFDEYSRERAEIERAERKAKAKEAKENFMKLLEEADLDGKSSYSTFVTKYGKDERFKAVEKNRDREDYFKDFVDELYKKEKEEKRKQKEEAKNGFIELLKEQEDLHRRSKWSKVKKQIDEDPRYRTKPLDSSWREELFREYVSSLPEKDASDDEGKDDHDAPKTAEEIAIENRKREVESELNEQKKERNKEKEIMLEKEEIESYKVILKDLIKHGDYSWHDARKILKKDSRYKRLDYLTREMKEDIYKEHVRELNRKRQDVLFKLFSEESDWNPNTRWKDVKKNVLSDEKYSKFSENEKRLESDFREWRRVRLDELLREFREFLKEVKIITHESKQKILHNEGHLSDILAVLQTDKRYLVLDSCPEERELELERYIEDLDRKGPPPPPTASTSIEEH